MIIRNYDLKFCLKHLSAIAFLILEYFFFFVSFQYLSFWGTKKRVEEANLCLFCFKTHSHFPFVTAASTTVCFFKKEPNRKAKNNFLLLGVITFYDKSTKTWDLLMRNPINKISENIFVAKQVLSYFCPWTPNFPRFWGVCPGSYFQHQSMQ